MLTKFRNNVNFITVRIKCRPDNKINEIKEEIIIEKYLQSILKPFNIMQALFFCAKYKLEEDLIIQNSLSYYIRSAVGIIFYICGSFGVLFASTYTTYTKKHPDLMLFGNINDIVVFVSGILLDFYTNITQKRNNVLLVSSIQNVHSILKINGNIFKRFIIFNWIYVIALIVFHILWIFYYCSFFSGLSLSDIIESCLHICFDINIVYTAMVMKLNTKTVTVWVENVQNAKCNKDERFWNSYFKAYVEILKSYQLIETTVQKQVGLTESFKFVIIKHLIASRLFQLEMKYNLWSVFS